MSVISISTCRSQIAFSRHRRVEEVSCIPSGATSVSSLFRRSRRQPTTITRCFRSLHPSNPRHSHPRLIPHKHQGHVISHFLKDLLRKSKLTCGTWSHSLSQDKRRFSFICDQRHGQNTIPTTQNNNSSRTRYVHRPAPVAHKLQQTHSTTNPKLDREQHDI